jgi:hypothetical protein
VAEGQADDIGPQRQKLLQWRLGGEIDALFFCPCDVRLGELERCSPGPPVSGLIVPGSSVAGVKLGSSLADFEAVFPRDPRADEDYPETLCGGRSYHWVNVEGGGRGVYVYLKGDKIYQLSAEWPRLALSNGIMPQTDEGKVKSHYRNGREYILVGSGQVVVGGKNLVYWVDQKAGIAFELYWNPQKKQRLVRRIDIFQPGSDYRPDGCISPPRQWQEVNRSHR